MNQVFAFHDTVQGHLHVMNECPCEDSSLSFSAESGRYHIAIVADGHGAKSCFRSAYGAKTATEAALVCLQHFAEATLASEELEERFYRDIFSNHRYRKMTIRRLTDTILAEWHDRVLEDYYNNPPTPEEMRKNTDECQNMKNPAHIYGTTLIAALKLPQCLILLHQGDGRCDVFYENGSVDQPIPWDSRCEDTATTSLCDEDAAERFRSCVINLVEKPVIACYVGCDGIEDAYRDTYEGLGGSHSLMGGVHAFYKYLTCQIIRMGQDKFRSWLPEFLAEFSANGIFSRSGSGDDVSVSGIIDMSKAALFAEDFSYDTKLYALEEDLFWKENDLRGKKRKHGILKKRLDDAQLALENAVVAQNEDAESLVQLQDYRTEYEHKIEAAKEELEDYRQDVEDASGQFEERYATRFAVAVQHLIDEMSIGYSRKEAAYTKLLEQLTEIERKIRQAEEKVKNTRENILELEAKRNKAQCEYEEYDAKYRAIDSERVKIIEQIAVLKGNR